LYRDFANGGTASDPFCSMAVRGLAGDCGCRAVALPAVRAGAQVRIKDIGAISKGFGKTI